jgi:hypothetical protein
MAGATIPGRFPPGGRPSPPYLTLPAPPFPPLFAILPVTPVSTASCRFSFDFRPSSGLLSPSPRSLQSPGAAHPFSPVKSEQGTPPSTPSPSSPPAFVAHRLQATPTLSEPLVRTPVCSSLFRTLALGVFPAAEPFPVHAGELLPTAPPRATSQRPSPLRDPQVGFAVLSSLFPSLFRRV